MCGRYGVEPEYVQLALRYQAVVDAIDPGPRYNVAPSQDVPVIVERDGVRSLTHHRWGLIPFWAKDASIGNRLINARAETVATLPAFRDSFAHRRCIVPASRFYEWRRAGKVKVPHAIQRNDGFPMSFAGLWSSWRSPETTEPVHTCTIITTTANEAMAPIHDRMPVILDDDALRPWLDPTLADIGELQRLLVPCADDALYAYPISRLVNDVRNDSPRIIEPDPYGEELLKSAVSP
ncbi:MAG TPA: SOS response-associated peptidase [Chloroflexota bacterium]|nr:SOS response-associated peptidase [Chloroflexota bacterium]